jgi:hypothetical protein
MNSLHDVLRIAGVRFVGGGCLVIIAFWQNRQKGQVIAFFDPENDIVTSPPSSVPARSWKMDDVTKKWLCAGHSPEEQASLLQQVADD